MIEKLKIKDLKLLERNPRKITKEAMAKLVASLDSDPGFLDSRPILVNIVDGVYTVYGGNQRVRAAKKLGWKEIQCAVEHDLDAKMMKDRVVKDNKTYGEFDWDILANEYDPESLLNSGFEIEDLVGVEPIEQIEAEEDPQENLNPGEDKDSECKSGDIYELISGSITHRLGCGDSTDPDHVSKLLDGNEPILMVTDPPYGVEYNANWRSESLKDGAKRSNGKVQNDGQINWALAWHLFPGSVAYVWHAGKYCSEVQKSLEEADFEIISQIVWAKQHFAISRGDYHWKHEPCWYAHRKGHPHNWQGSRKETTVWEIANLNCFGKSKEDGEERTSHSTQKPIDCMSIPIRNNTAEGEGVYDPFLGSGTTLIACEQLGRVFYGSELSSAYCDIIIDRWVKFMRKNNKEYSVKKNGEVI